MGSFDCNGVYVFKYCPLFAPMCHAPRVRNRDEMIKRLLGVSWRASQVFPQSDLDAIGRSAALRQYNRLPAGVRNLMSCFVVLYLDRFSSRFPTTLPIYPVAS